MPKTFGVEIEVGIVNTKGKKPTEKNFEKAFEAFKNFREKKTKERLDFFHCLSRNEKNDFIALHAISEKISKKQAAKLEKEYLFLLKKDEKELFREILKLDKRMEKNFFFANNFLEIEKNLHGLLGFDKEFLEFEKILKKKVLIEMAFFKLLPIVASVQSQLQKKDKNFVCFDESDAIEITTSPAKRLDQAEKELFDRINKIEKVLEKKELFLFFGPRNPKTKNIGLLKKIGLGEDQNFLGLHLHIGNFANKKEMAKYYNKIISFFEKNPGIIERERIEYYGLKNPKRLNENSKRLEKKVLRMFGKNSKLERANRPTLSNILSKLNSKQVNYFSRDNATVFFRPEYKTIEVRAFGTKGKGIGKTKENLRMNIEFLEDFLKELEKLD
jgi:hypothetical protein